MAWNVVISACSVLLILCAKQSVSQLLPQVQLAPYQQSQSQAASLSKAPVGLYSRSSPFGDQESAASLSGTPVGLFSRRNSVPRFVNVPSFYSQPFFYPYAFKPPVYQVPPPRFPVARPPRPQVYPAPPSRPRPVKGPKKPNLGSRPGILSGIAG